MAVLADLEERERYLLSILLDDSGVDQAEFLWKDETAKDVVFRCYDYQVPWYRERAKQQVDQGARAIGKSLGIQMRSFAFPFTNPGEEMLLTAPEMIHLDPVTKYVEDRITSCRLSREFLKTSATSSGFTHRPFEAKFRNGSKIVGRIPQRDGKGVKGQHPKKLEMDEAQDYPAAGWAELSETLKFSDENASWRSHGVSNGVRDYFFKLTQPGSGWHVSRITAMHRPDWSKEERESKIEFHGGRDSVGYRRNILGLHGDASSALFVLTRLMQCVDQNKDSAYNTEEYYSVRISDEQLRESKMPIDALLDFPASHRGYDRVWVGMDVGMTNHPSEVLVFGETHRQLHGGAKAGDPEVKLKLLSRIHLQRISAPDQRRLLEAVYDFYRPKAIAMDRTGLGLPIFQDLKLGENQALAQVMRGYNFSEKITIGYEPREENDVFFDEENPNGEPIKANVLQYSSDMLRVLVDQEQMTLPWDIDLLREFQGQTYTINRSSTDPYGRKIFNAGKFHALDAVRMAALGFLQERIDAMNAVEQDWGEPIFDSFLV